MPISCFLSSDKAPEQGYKACALSNAACRKFKAVRYICLPELLEEMILAQATGELKKAMKGYRKVDLLILDEWLIRRLTPQLLRYVRQAN